jgi:outer membrane protein OmpA-like peptidoglycan-associated protein
MQKLKRFLPVMMIVATLTFSPKSFAESRDVVHNDYGTVVHTELSGTCVRTKWMNPSDPCAPAVAVPPPEPAPPQVQVQEQVRTVMSREDRTIYFGFNLASLTPEMQQRLDTLATNMRADSQVRGARIVGYADRIGNPSYNEQLSKKRAENVRKYLVSKGMINTQIADTRWYGEQNPATTCDSKLKRPELINCLQRDRRVEVELDFATDQRASR